MASRKSAAVAKTAVALTTGAHVARPPWLTQIWLMNSTRNGHLSWRLNAGKHSRGCDRIAKLRDGGAVNSLLDQRILAWQFHLAIVSSASCAARRSGAFASPSRKRQ